MALAALSASLLSSVQVGHVLRTTVVDALIALAWSSLASVFASFSSLFCRRLDVERALPLRWRLAKKDQEWVGQPVNAHKKPLPLYLVRVGLLVLASLLTLVLLLVAAREPEPCETIQTPVPLAPLQLQLPPPVLLADARFQLAGVLFA